MDLLLGIDGMGEPLLPQVLGAGLLTVRRIIGAWLAVGLPGLALALWLGSSVSALGRYLRAGFEALGGIPPLFILLLSAYAGFTERLSQSLVVWLVLLPEVVRRLTDAVADAYRQPFVSFAAEYQGLSASQIRRWLVLPAVMESVHAMALVTAFRILVFDITMGFLGYGQVSAVSTFGELFRNNRYLFLLPNTDSGHVLPVLAGGVVVIVIFVQALTGVLLRFSGRIVQGGRSCIDDRRS